MVKNKKKNKHNKQSNPQRDSELKRIKEWIETFDFKTKIQIKSQLNQLSADNISYIANNLSEFTEDNFSARIKEIQTKQNNSSQTGATPMTDTSIEDFKKLHPNIKPEEINDAYALYQSNITEFFTQYYSSENNKKPENSGDEQKPIEHQENNTSNEEHTSANTAGCITIDENTEETPTIQNTDEEENLWYKNIIKSYEQKYDTEDEKMLSIEPLEEGIHIEIKPHTKDDQVLTGTAINYYSPDHVEIQKTQDGVEPKDQSFQHFMDHMSILKEQGCQEVEFGNVQSPEFRTKVLAAALANNMICQIKEGDELNFSAETLKEIPVEAQSRLLAHAIKSGAKLDFGENSPLLDFNNEAVKNLPEDLKYKYLAQRLQDESTKDKIENAPKVEFFTKAKDLLGNDILDQDGKPITTNNPALDTLSDDELSTLRIHNRQQQIDELKTRVVGKNADGSDITLEETHSKVEELRSRLKTGENRQEVLNNVTTQTHGKNFFKYAQKHIQNNH